MTVITVPDTDTSVLEVLELEEHFKEDIPCFNCEQAASWSVRHTRNAQCEVYLCQVCKEELEKFVSKILAYPGSFATLTCKVCGSTRIKLHFEPL